MTVLLTCGCCFAIGFQAGCLLVSTSLILTERDTEPAPIPAPEAKMFPSYQRYLARAELVQ